MKDLSLLILMLTASAVLSQDNKDKIDSLGQILLERTGTTGSYVSICKGDSVIYSSAFGYNDPESKTRINDSTVFPISSNTKAFNSILLTQLMEQDQLDFNTPIKQYIPDLEFKEDYITDNINLTDLLTHRWGIPRYDFTYYMLSEQEKQNANEAVFRKLKYLELTSPFRTQFQYGNNQYILASFILESITKEKWESQLSEKLLQPLNMYDTHCDLERYIKSVNRSQGYQNKVPVDIKLVKPLYEVSGMGNMFSSIRDLEKWSKFLLNGDDSILSKELINYNLSSHFNIGFEEPYKGFSSMSYGFGWFIFDYFGHKVVLHHGDNVGHQSLIVLMPDDGLSFLIVANEGMQSYGFPFSMAYSLMDLFIGQRIKDWGSLLPMNMDINKDSIIEQPDPLTLNIQDYQGEFLHEGFGTIKIYLSKDKLMIKAGAYSDELTHWNFDTFKAYSEEFQIESTVNFILNDKKEVISIQTDLIEPGIEMIEFKKKQ